MPSPEEIFIDKITKLSTYYQKNCLQNKDANDGSEFSNIAIAISVIENSRLRRPEELFSLLASPSTFTTSIALQWFEYGLLYAREYGIPADILRMFPGLPLDK